STFWRRWGATALAICLLVHPTPVPSPSRGGGRCGSLFSPPSSSSALQGVRRLLLAYPNTLLQPVLVEAPALHDDAEIFALLLQNAEVLERVAVDDEEIGKGTGLEAAELAHLAHDLRPDQRGGADDLDRPLHLRADDELARLLGLQLPQEVGAVGYRHA